MTNFPININTEYEQKGLVIVHTKFDNENSSVKDIIIHIIKDSYYNKFPLKTWKIRYPNFQTQSIELSKVFIQVLKVAIKECEELNFKLHNNG
jgi:hypothetical protein